MTPALKGHFSELRGCVKEEVDILGSPSLVFRTISVDFSALPFVVLVSRRSDSLLALSLFSVRSPLTFASWQRLVFYHPGFTLRVVRSPRVVLTVLF